ncbi:mitochondrial import receptor subunit TOM40 homolog [Pectinophora gossypiella]|uniref:mitochondrial import receptor subunit TOM40 homolog n=1 Tax=Pectinophora gossypiella TaxID=13191 RepID=UPI00214E52AA|nr:mitochondrial import receptor subunit TOM40 homolog [Pectinophora gossypiella]
MDFNDNIIKEEVSSFVSSLQRLLPRKKEIIVIEPLKPKLIRLTDVHIEAKSVFPKCFIGAKLIILREVMNRVKLVQQYNYGKSKDSHRCYSQLINKEMEPKRSEDGLLIDSTGSATATYTESLDNNYEMRLTSKIRDLVSSETELVLEKETEKAIGSMTLSMNDVDPSTFKIVGQWMQQVLPELGVGAEVAFKPLSYPPKPDVSISTRYERESFALSSTISKAGFQICLYKQFAPDLRISTIVHENNRGSPPTIGIALHKDYENGSEMKIFVDSEKCGGFTFQKDVLFKEHSEMRVVRLVWSTLIDRQKRVRFGFGFNLDF